MFQQCVDFQDMLFPMSEPPLRPHQTKPLLAGLEVLDDDFAGQRQRRGELVRWQRLRRRERCRRRGARRVKTPRTYDATHSIRRLTNCIRHPDTRFSISSFERSVLGGKASTALS